MILRPYQKDCYDSIIADLDANIALLGVIAPASAGKTVIFIETAKHFIRTHPDKKVLVLSTLGILTDQTFDRFKSFAPELKIGILQAERIPERDCQVVIATVQSAQDEDKILHWAWSKDTNIGLIIGDEIHSLLDTARFKKAVEQHKAQVVGFSASFYREAQLITNLFDRISYQISVQELIDQQWLVPIQLKQVLVSKEAEFPERAAIFLKIYLEELKGKKTFIYCSTVEETGHIAALFLSHGIQCATITGNVTGQLRRDLMQSFEQGKTDVLITCNVLSQGVDSQKLSAILDIYGTGSPTLFIQRSGRLGRTQDGYKLSPTHWKQTATYYTAASAPQIKAGFYKSMLDYALNEGDKKREKDCFTEKEYLDLLLEPKTSQTYMFTHTLCEIAESFKALGLVNVYDLIRTKKIPDRYLKSLDLVKLALQGNIEKDNWLAVEKAMREGAKNSPEMRWIVPSGKQCGKHVKDLPYYYKEWVLTNAPNSYVGKLLIEWSQNKKEFKKVNSRF